MFSDVELLDRIQAKRAANNINWVDLLRLAFEVAPERARAIVKRIDETDGELKDLSRQLAKGPAPSTKDCPDQRSGCHISDYHVH